MDSPYPTAPELPNKVPQLVRDGKSTKPEELEPSTEEPELDEDEGSATEPDELNEYVDDPGDPDGVVAAEQERRQQASRPKQLIPPKEPRKRKKWWIIPLALVLIAAGGYVVYTFTTKKASAPSSQTPVTTPSPAKEAPTEAAATSTKTYESTNFTLSFDYPSNWIVSDTATKLTVTSPATQLKTSSGSNESTHTVVTIQNQQPTIPGYPTNGAVAALTSEKLTYKQPTAVQRAQTYLSYLGYKTTGLDALYITGDNGYQQGQAIPMSDVVKGNPLVNTVFVSCKTVDCTSGTPTPLTLDAEAWQKSATSKQVTALLQSLQFN